MISISTFSGGRGGEGYEFMRCQNKCNQTKNIFYKGRPVK